VEAEGAAAAGDAGPAEDTDAAAGGRKLTRRRAAAGALLAAACAIVAIVLSSGGHGRGDAPTTGVPAGETTATVTRRTLTENSTVDGTLGYGATLELYDRLAGTFTWLPPVGATIARGGTLFRVDNLPVALMYGTVPAYRTLKEGVGDGPDVAELNRNLIDLGYDPYGAITDVEAFGEGTAAAVRRWQKAEGLPETGEVELGRVVFAPSARRVTAVHVTLGQDPPAGSGSPSSTDSPGAGQAPGAPAADESPSKAGTSKPGKAKEKPGKGKGKGKGKPRGAGKPSGAGKPEKQGTGKEGDSDQAPAGDAGKGSSSDEPKSDESEKQDADKPEGGGGAGTAVLTTTSTQQLVQLKLKPEQQQLAHVGEQAPVSLPDGGVVHGTITEVGTVASEAKGDESERGSSPSEGSSESTIPVTLALAHRVPHLDEAPVSVELVKSVRRDVLAVPATALFATAGGGYAIELLAASPAGGGERRVQLAVTPGMFADGYVQVQGAGLREGQTVIESE